MRTIRWENAALYRQRAVDFQVQMILYLTRQDDR